MMIQMMKVINIFILMIWSLSLTIVIELLLGLLIGIRKKDDIFHLIVINFITNPILNYVMTIIRYFFSNYFIIYLCLFFFELIVMYVEYKFYRNRLKFRRISPLILSIILNFSSVIIGFIINNL